MIRTLLGALVVRLDAEQTRYDVSTSAGSVQDAVITSIGRVVVLERLTAGRYAVRYLAMDGSTVWRHIWIGTRSHSGEVPARLLIDSHDQIFLAHGDHSLVHIAETTATIDGVRSDHRHIIMCPDDRVGFIRSAYNAVTPNTRIRSPEWTTLDLESQSETTTEISLTKPDSATRVIGSDSSGQVYMIGFHGLTRRSESGEIDWEPTLPGIAFSKRDGATLHYTSRATGTGLLADKNNVVELNPSEFEESPGVLVGREEDDGYLMYSLEDGTYGRLTHLDAAGRFLRTEQAPEDILMRCDEMLRPSHSSVTPDGKVLVPVHTGDGVYVVALQPTTGTRGSATA
jgi:hypothetical protein